MSNLTLENDYYYVEIADPTDLSDKHFYTRYSFCGYITRIYNKIISEDCLSSPREIFSPFSGEGFPDEFEQPVGYDEAEVNAGFIKIGVGTERKKNNADYTNHDEHNILETARTTSFKTDTSVSFYQEHNLRNYSYAYSKKIVLTGDKIVISHNLMNTGEKDFRTLWYSHAFIENHAAERYSLIIPCGYEICGGRSDVIGVGVNGENGESRQISFDNKKAESFCCCWRCKGAENIQALYRNGTSVYAAKGDFTADELQLFVNKYVLSVEPKVAIYLKASDFFKWSTEYSFI